MPETAPDREPTPKGDDGGTDDTPVKLFAAWLQEQRDGLLHSELSDALAEVSAAVIDLNKAGSLELKLKINPAGKGQAAVFVTDEVKAKPPQDRQSMMFFSDGHGNLSRRDPNQTALPLKDVSRPEPKPRPE